MLSAVAMQSGGRLAHTRERWRATTPPHRLDPGTAPGWRTFLRTAEFSNRRAARRACRRRRTGAPVCGNDSFGSAWPLNSARRGPYGWPPLQGSGQTAVTVAALPLATGAVLPWWSTTALRRAGALGRNPRWAWPSHNGDPPRPNSLFECAGSRRVRARRRALTRPLQHRPEQRKPKKANRLPHSSREHPPS
jgi:hypothetical protein